MRLCRAALGEEEKLVAICQDEARSGAFIVNRPGLTEAIRMICERRVEVLLAEIRPDQPQPVGDGADL